MQDVQSKKSISEQPLPCFGEHQVSTKSFRKVVQRNLLITRKNRQLRLGRTVLLNSFSLVSLITLMLAWSLWPRVICCVQIGGVCSECPYIPLN